MSTPSTPDHGPGRSGSAPHDPATSVDTEPDTDEPPTEPSPSTGELPGPGEKHISGGQDDRPDEDPQDEEKFLHAE